MSEKILVAVDGSKYSKKAFEYSLNEAKQLNKSITILKVVPTLGYPENLFDESIKSKVEEAENLTQKWKKEATNENVEANAEVMIEEDAATGIAKYADKENFDLIILGSRGKTDLETVHLGSVSEGVVKRARCPVLVVR